MMILFDRFNMPDDLFEIVFATKQQKIVAAVLINYMKEKGGEGVGVNAHYDLSMKFVMFHAVGVALATVLLLGVMGSGFLAGLLLMPLVVAGIGALVIAQRMTRRGGAAAPPAPAPSRPVEAKRREEAIVAMVTEAQGVCPRGYRFYVGQNWTLNGAIHGDTEVCPVAAAKLAEAAASFRRDGEGLVGMALCQTGQHRVAFQLSGQAEASEEPDQSS
jgi:hypothetical protein